MSDRNPPITVDRGAERRPRDPGFVFGALSAAVLILLATIALTEAAPAPPAIAEFAPKAVEQIKESPAELQAAIGQPGRGGGTAGTTTTVPPEPEAVVSEPDEPTRVPRTRRCVGDPPRQTEDPQSPPCVPYFIGDNGGATSKGVTASEVRIAIPAWNADANDQGERRKIYDGLTPFFNDRFEFYGRQIVLVPVGPSTAPTGSGGELQQKMIAIAAEADEKNVFASFGMWGPGGTYYSAEVRRRGILHIGGALGAEFEDLAEARALAPYAWSYAPPPDVTVRGMGEWACKQLVGRPAEFAKNERRGLPRRFGVLYPEFEGRTNDKADLLDQIIQGCGGDPVLAVSAPAWTPNRAGDPNQNAAYRTNTAKMCDPAERITTVIVFVSMNDLFFYDQAFTSQQCFPEWIVDGTQGGTDENPLYKGRTTPEQRNGSAFGLTWKNMQIPFVDEPGFMALKEANPNFQYDQRAYAQGASQAWTRWQYRPYLMLASGIQTAGPRLTPKTFEAGLHRTVFPNPPHPSNAAKVDFTDGDYWMVDDAAVIWWSEDGLDPTTAEPGAWCYIHGGAARYRLGTFPADPLPLFQPPCVSGAR